MSSGPWREHDKYRHFNVWVPATMLVAVSEAAARVGVSKSEFVRMAIERLLKEVNK